MIELFKEPNIDWMGKAKYFYALSGILLIAGWTSIFMQGGLRYSIDFKGGTNVDVRFAQPPNIDQIRSGVERRKASAIAKSRPSATSASSQLE